MISGAVALISLTFVLSVFQIRWINDSVRAERKQMETRLYDNVSQAVIRSTDEFRALISIIVLRYRDDLETYLNEVAESIRFWSEHANKPELLENVFVVGEDESNEPYRYSSSERQFIIDTIPEEIVDLIRQHSEPEAQPLGRYNEHTFKTSGMIMLDILSLEPGRKNDRIGRIIIDVNLDVLYTEVLPSNMAQFAPEYPYRVIHSGEILFSSDTGLDARVPEMNIPLFLRPVSPQPQIKPRGERSERTLDLPQNIVLRFWYKRTFGDENESDDFVSESGSDLKSYISAYYPGESVNTLIERRRYVNLGMSLGFSILITAALLLLYRMYAREEKLRSREREFVASMSHELRTPISVVRSISENIADGVVKDRARMIEYGALIRNHASRLGRMVDSILLTAEMNSGTKERFEYVEVALETIVDEVIRSLSPTAEESEVDIVRMGDNRRFTVKSDPTAVRLVVENLLVNAVRHGAGNDDTRAQIRVNIIESNRSNGANGVNLVVEDDGPGIASKEIGKVFTAFYRGERSVRNQIPGSGLGLYIVRRVVEMLGGTIHIESPYADENNAFERNGTRCTVYLPSGRSSVDE